jgi:hypothetical protein
VQRNINIPHPRHLDFRHRYTTTFAAYHTRRR